MLETLVTAPGSEPLTREEAKLHCRVNHALEDDLFDRWVGAAREYVETWTGRQLMAATWRLWLPTFWSGSLELPHAPLRSVSSITYYDSANNSQTFGSSNYVVLTPDGPKARPGRVELAYGSTYPTTYARPDAVTINLTAGYSDAADTAKVQRAAVPAALKAAMLLLISEMNERREQVTVGVAQSPNTLRAESLMEPFVVRGQRWSG